MVAVIKDIDHAFASTAHQVMVGARAVVSWEQRKLNPEASQIEAISAMIPVYGPEIELLERLVFASFGVLAAALHVSGGNVKAVADANPGLFVLREPKTSHAGAPEEGPGCSSPGPLRGGTLLCRARFRRVEFYSDFVTWTRWGNRVSLPSLDTFGTKLHQKWCSG
jgi:hypothetical protein